MSKTIKLSECFLIPQPLAAEILAHLESQPLGEVYGMYQRFASCTNAHPDAVRNGDYELDHPDEWVDLVLDVCSRTEDAEPPSV